MATIPAQWDLLEVTGLIQVEEQSVLERGQTKQLLVWEIQAKE